MGNAWEWDKTDGSFLADDFEITGTDRKEFENHVREMDRHTLVWNCRLKDIHVLRIRSLKKHSLEECGFYRMRPEKPMKDGNVEIVGCEETCKETDGFCLDSFRLDSDRRKKTASSEKRFRRRLESELQSGDTIFYITDLKYACFLSPKAVDTLNQRLKSFGEGSVKFPRTPSLPRDCYLAEAMNRDDKVNLVIRHEDGIGRVFAVMGSKYRKECEKERQGSPGNRERRKQNREEHTLGEIIDVYEWLTEHGGLGEPECEGWEITHDVCRICLSFPEKAAEWETRLGLKERILPCLEFQTSATGDSSLQINGCWKFPSGGMVYGKRVSRTHRERLKEETVARRALEEIVGEWEWLPRRMKYLETVRGAAETEEGKPVDSPSRNRKAAMDCFKKILAMKEIKAVIGTERVRSYSRYLDWNIKEERPYTAYDVVAEMISLPDNAEKSKSMEPGLVRLGKESSRKWKRLMMSVVNLEYPLK